MSGRRAPSHRVNPRVVGAIPCSQWEWAHPLAEQIHAAQDPEVTQLTSFPQAWASRLPGPRRTQRSVTERAYRPGSHGTSVTMASCPVPVLAAPDEESSDRSMRLGRTGYASVSCWAVSRVKRIALLVLSRQPVADHGPLDLQLPAIPTSLKPLRARCAAGWPASAPIAKPPPTSSPRSARRAPTPSNTPTARPGAPSRSTSSIRPLTWSPSSATPAAGGHLAAASAVAASPSCTPSATRSPSNTPTPAPA
jgi:hypothetical protein